MSRNHPPKYENWSEPGSSLTDYQAATADQAAEAIRQIGELLHVPVMLGQPSGDADRVGECYRCRQDGRELWQLGRLLMCRPCWQDRSDFQRRLDWRLENEPAQHLPAVERPGWGGYRLPDVRREIGYQPPRHPDYLFGEEEAA
jgi:hypothetical protein